MFSFVDYDFLKENICFIVEFLKEFSLVVIFYYFCLIWEIENLELRLWFF